MNKKHILISVVCFLLVFSPCGELLNRNVSVNVEAKKSYVYYVPNSSYAYHCIKSCRTLSRSKKIAKTTLKKAKTKLGLRACKVCH